MNKVVFFLLMVMAFMIPWDAVISFGTFGTMLRAIGILTTVLGVLALISRGSLRKMILLHRLMILFVAFAVLSLLWSEDVDTSIGDIQTYVQLLLFAWLIWEFVQDAPRQRLLMQAFIWGGGVGVLSQLVGFGKVHAVASAAQQRMEGGGMDLNEFSLGLLLTMIMAVYCALNPQVNRLLRIAYWLYCPVCAVSILLTGSRMGLVAACLAGGLLGIVFLLKRPLYGLVVLLLGGGVIYVVPFVLPESTQMRLMSTIEEFQSGTGHWSGRFEIWEAALKLHRDYELCGTGVAAIGSVMIRGGGSETQGKAVHNVYLSLLLELGDIGLAIFLSILIVVGIYSFKLPYLERYTWQIIFFIWITCAFSLSIADRKPFWFILGLFACQFATFGRHRLSKSATDAPGSAAPLVRLPAGNRLNKITGQ